MKTSMAVASFLLGLVASVPVQANDAGTTRTLEFVAPTEPVLRGDPFELKLIGLAPGATVRVGADRIWGRRNPALYRAEATFEADEAGMIDVRRDAPTDAPWEGVDPNGLLWSMRPTDDPLPEGRSSSVVQVTADVDGDGAPDARTTIDMVRARDDLVEFSLDDRFPGAFLLRPPGDEPLPAIIVLGGSEGGDSAARSTGPKLASRGYAVVGLPYYSPAWWGNEPQFPELPRAFHDIPVDRLEEVRDYLRTRADVDGSHIGIYGGSKGAELALLAGSLIDGFSAIAAIVPSDVVWEAWGPGTEEGRDSCFSWRGEPLPFVPYKGMSEEIAKFQTEETARIRTPHDAGRAANPDRVGPARIRVEDIDEPVFLVGGDEDNTWDSGGMARNIKRTRNEAGLETIAIVDPDAGHGLSGDGTTPTSQVEARVEGEAFPSMLRFFERHLKSGSTN